MGTARRLFRKLVKSLGDRHGGRSPTSCEAMRSPVGQLGQSAVHRPAQYQDNGAEGSHQHTEERERQLRRFKSRVQIQRILAVDTTIRDTIGIAHHRFEAIQH